MLNYLWKENGFYVHVFVQNRCLGQVVPDLALVHRYQNGLSQETKSFYLQSFLCVVFAGFLPDKNWLYKRMTGDSITP